MPPRNPLHYTAVQKLLHWAIAALILLQVLLAKLADNAGSDLRELALLANHKSVGITILALVAVRLLWRLAKRPPSLPDTLPTWQTRAAAISHGSLYVLLFALPVSGWLMSSASSYTVSWFNLFPLPDFVAPDPDLKETLETIHETLAWSLVAIAGVHILAAIKHAVVDADGVLQRITSPFSLVVAAVILVAGAATLGTAGLRTTLADTASAEPNASPDLATRPVSDRLSLWDIDYRASHIRFTGEQAGADFDGTWESWQADIRFDGRDLNHSSMAVTIATGAVSTGDEERDVTLGDAEWFDSDRHPQAFFVAQDFERNDDGTFTAAGSLTVKGRRAPVRLDFSVEEHGGERLLRGDLQPRLLLGTALLDRLAFGIGTGEWADTEWIGQFVNVRVRVEATVGEAAVQGAP